jgi:hypothetical protein
MNGFLLVSEWLMSSLWNSEVLLVLDDTFFNFINISTGVADPNPERPKWPLKVKTNRKQLSSER